jgi:hypothetical protein
MMDSLSRHLKNKEHVVSEDTFKHDRCQTSFQESFVRWIIETFRSKEQVEAVLNWMFAKGWDCHEKWNEEKQLNRNAMIVAINKECLEFAKALVQRPEYDIWSPARDTGACLIQCPFIYLDSDEVIYPVLCYLAIQRATFLDLSRCNNFKDKFLEPCTAVHEIVKCSYERSNLLVDALWEKCGLDMDNIDLQSNPCKHCKKTALQVIVDDSLHLGNDKIYSQRYRTLQSYVEQLFAAENYLQNLCGVFTDSMCMTIPNVLTEMIEQYLYSKEREKHRQSIAQTAFLAFRQIDVNVNLARNEQERIRWNMFHESFDFE